MSTMTIEKPASDLALKDLAGDRFVYVTYIRTTPEMLWDALTRSEFTRDYWFGTALESTWKTGAAWAALMPDGRLNTEGVVLACEPCTRLVLSWQPRVNPAMAAEGAARCTFELDRNGDTVKLTVIHESGRAG
ncbi:MAG TPA: SRPBCC domain-containing protein, partial [Phycisphaerae bacterium]|nr:SRPBCC domain-containing protein [Phycisphaerae bacterium]